MADAAAAALPGLGDDQPGARLQVLADVAHPVLGAQAVGTDRVLQADLGEDDELAGQLLDVAGLLLVAEGHGPVRDFDVPAAVGLAERPVVLEAVLQQVLLEEGAAEEEADVVLGEHRDLGAQVPRHHGGAPPELDEVDQLAGA